MPSFSASASMNGLNAEPGWRWPCVARLNGLGVVVAADHRPHLAGLVVDHDQRGARAGRPASRWRSRCWAALLELDVERRLDLQPALERRRAPWPPPSWSTTCWLHPGREVRVLRRLAAAA